MGKLATKGLRHLSRWVIPDGGRENSHFPPGRGCNALPNSEYIKPKATPSLRKTRRAHPFETAGMGGGKGGGRRRRLPKLMFPTYARDATKITNCLTGFGHRFKYEGVTGVFWQVEFLGMGFFVMLGNGGWPDVAFKHEP